MTIIVAGGVADVTAAVEAGAACAGALGKVYGCEVIARPHAELLKFFDMDAAEA